jgi:hypothetical protein
MFEKMRQAMFTDAFMPRPGADPNAERQSFEMIHAIGDNPQTGGQSRNFDTHEAVLRAARFAPARAAMKLSTVD